MITRIQPPDWAEPSGYANGILIHGALIFVGGQIGWNARQQFETDDFVAQTCQALQNIAVVLRAGGTDPEHTARMTWYIVDRLKYNVRLKEIGLVYRAVMGRNFPAMTFVQVAGLIEERAKIEIEVTALMPD